MDLPSQIPQAPPQATGVVYQPTPIHPAVMAVAGKEPTTQCGDGTAAGKDPGMELGEPAENQPNATVPEKGGEADAANNPAGEGGLSVVAEVTPKAVGKTGAARPTGKEEEEKGTPKLLLKRVSVQAYQRRTTDQETPETEASRPPKPTAIMAAPGSSEVEATGQPTKETKDPSGKTVAAKPDQEKVRRQRTATSTTDTGSGSIESQAAALPRVKVVDVATSPVHELCEEPASKERGATDAELWEAVHHVVIWMNNLPGKEAFQDEAEARKHIILECGILGIEGKHL